MKIATLQRHTMVAKIKKVLLRTLILRTVSPIAVAEKEQKQQQTKTKRHYL